ncbi:SDR family NAD(P)-dependent oxidoreductase [Ornithinimicrobium sp. W1665]|uniref:SDR family NAD(P)-dependent oxidoreductase n=1 Tax=Ornithinimicrobium sp. W1665 TaxID=3416666 RepID=UPI003CEE4452
MSHRSLSGSQVAVLGASGVLGSQICQVLASRGATVVGVGRDEERLAAATRDLPSSSVLVGDLTDAGLGDRLVEHVRSGPGRLDGLVNAAGVVAFGPLVDTPDEVVEELFLTNVVGPLWLLRRVLPLLVETDGFVAQISGVVADRPTAGMAAYGASKAALAAADRALGTELRRSGVSVVDLRVPHTETGLVGRALSGTAPRLPQGLEPAVVAERVVEAVERGEAVVEASAFG